MEKLGPRGTYIKEVVLENFMSHEYSRIPFRPGLNLIAGPNGAGKSSIVLAIAVALGQTRTERSRRLRDLIRRGRDLSRVTVVFDNSPVEGRRPIPWFREDEIRVSRYIRADGTYWFELNYRTVDKYELTSRLAKMGIDPDNMLVIMHQGTMAEFISMSPTERLVMVEEAAGLHEYRERVLRAMREMAGVEAEVSKTQDLLRRAEETLGVWRAKYEKLLERRRLEERARELRAELAWAKYERQRELVNQLEAELESTETEVGEVESESAQLSKVLARLKEDFRGVGAAPPAGEWSEVWKRILDLHERIVDSAVRRAVLEYRLRELRAAASRLRSRLKRARSELQELETEAKSVERPSGRLRDPDEILEELRLVGARLASLGDVSDDVERMYHRYLQTYKEIRERLDQLEENRRKILEALQERAEFWRRAVRRLVSEVDGEFREILGRLGGIGYVRLVDGEEVESAGLEVGAGFRGMDPVPLESRALSGGERATTVVAFMLSLQRHVRSPIRVIDEFDVHMDPARREVALREFARVLSQTGGQSILVTPGPPPRVEGPVHLVFVQRVGEASRVAEA